MSRRVSAKRGQWHIWVAGGLALTLVVGVWGRVWRQQDGLGSSPFEAVNALFSGLAFACLLLALLLQRQELVLQRKELRQTRMQLKGQKEQLTLQNVTMKKQAFESTFFQLLSLHNDIVRSLDLSRLGQGPKHGRDCFELLYRKLRNHGSNPPTHVLDKSTRERWSGIYLAFFRDFQGEVGHYFRNLYHIIRFVDRADGLRDDERRLYTTLVRAQLSAYELVLLFYNCLTEELGAGKFEQLVHRYALLENLSEALLFDPADHKALFGPSAYGTGETSE